MTEPIKTEAYSTNSDDSSWTVECPECAKESEYEGFFDSYEIYECSCGCEFVATKMWIDDNNYIE